MRAEIFHLVFALELHSSNMGTLKVLTEEDAGSEPPKNKTKPKQQVHVLRKNKFIILLLKGKDYLL